MKGWGKMGLTGAIHRKVLSQWNKRAAQVKEREIRGSRESK